MKKSLYIIFFSFYAQALTAQLNMAYSIGVLGENLNTIAMGYHIFLESSDCFLASNGIMLFSKSNDGDFVFDCNDSKKEELIKNNLEVILYPNPADEYINIRFNSPVSNLKDFQILYLSVDGIVVKSSSATMYELLDGFQEDISSLKPGFYVVSLLSGGFVFTLKLLKK